MIRGKTASIFALISGVLLFAGSAHANLTNGSFEAPDASGGDVPCSADWTCFGSTPFTTSNLFRPGGGFVNPGAFDGTQVLKEFGVDAGAFQEVAVLPGNPVNASAYAINWAGDPFNNLGILQLSFYNADGAQVGGLTEAFCDSVGGQACVLTPQDGAEPSDWTLVSVGAVAPDGAATARLLLLHVLTDGTPAGGALFWDAASVQVIPVPAAVWLFGSALGLLAVARRRIIK